ncbi:hypothetical protein [uncultured Pseudodesulfovibrio sp.]|uniref:hypothetical protein n=1 Tax=uncultured Pseudodesulfovibrio sp. TaxID=2035858 RepID=UPI0029C6223B|nr:hypothetical protein [uncultured Pseudodesulfovibrio sp.]
MSSTNNIKKWLADYVDEEEYGQVLSLYEVVQEGEPINDFWEITVDGDKMFIRLGDGEWLTLLSNSAVETFIDIMDQTYGGGMGVEAWAASERAIDNDKS